MPDAPRIYVYDLESRPNLSYHWGLWGENISPKAIVEPQDILCFAMHKVGTKGVETYAAWDDYEAMIIRLHEMMDDADYLVGYNNSKYDDKHTRAAFIKLGLKPPSPHRTIDLLKVVKKNFVFPSHKLDYVCGALGLQVKADSGGMDTWIKCLNGDEVAQRRMLRYNKTDVRITTQLYTRLIPWISELNVPLYADGANGVTPTCMKCGSPKLQSRGFAYTPTYRYRRFQCQGCGGWMRSAKSEPIRTELRNA